MCNSYNRNCPAREIVPPPDRRRQRGQSPCSRGATVKVIAPSGDRFRRDRRPCLQPAGLPDGGRLPLLPARDPPAPPPFAGRQSRANHADHNRRRSARRSGPHRWPVALLASSTLRSSDVRIADEWPSDCRFRNRSWNLLAFFVSSLWAEIDRTRRVAQPGSRGRTVPCPLEVVAFELSEAAACRAIYGWQRRRLVRPVRGLRDRS